MHKVLPGGGVVLHVKKVFNARAISTEASIVSSKAFLLGEFSGCKLQI